MLLHNELDILENIMGRILRKILIVLIKHKHTFL